MDARARVILTRRLPPAVESRANRDYVCLGNTEDAPYSAAELIAHAADHQADALLLTPTDRIDGDLIAQLPDSVRILATFSVGYEHVDVAAAEQRGIIVTNTPDVLTDATAEIALLLMLGAARRAHEGEALLRSGQWTGWTPTQLVGSQLSGKRLGILGMGRIGQATARRAKAFGMAIHYHNRRPLPPEDADSAMFHETPEALLAVSDVLSVHCPATPETIGFLNAERLTLLPPGAIVINTARGAIIDDPALIAALKSGALAAAGLDVFDGEPAVHPGYAALPNTFLLPHLGSATTETRNAMGFKALDNLDAFFATGVPPNRVQIT